MRTTGTDSLASAQDCLVQECPYTVEGDRAGGDIVVRFALPERARLGELDLGTIRAARGDELQLTLSGRCLATVPLGEGVTVIRSSARLYKRKHLLVVALSTSHTSCTCYAAVAEEEDVWASPEPCDWPSDEVWPTSGYRPEFMIWRLLLRVAPEETGGHSEGTTTLRLMVGVQLEQLSVGVAEWPQEGLPVLVSLREHLADTRCLSEARVVLTRGADTATLELHRCKGATVAVAEREGKAWPLVLPAFTHLRPAGRAGALLPAAAVFLALGLAGGGRGPCVPAFCVVPAPAPPTAQPGSGEHQWVVPVESEWTGARLWDCGIVLACALPRLLASFGGRWPDNPSAGRSQSILEIGCGLGVPGVFAALLGFKCVATDLEIALGAAMGVAEANSQGIFEAGGAWCARALNWRQPPSWVLERSWDVLLGSELLYDSGMPCLNDIEEYEQKVRESMHETLLRLLSRITFSVFYLAERERCQHVTRTFFRRLKAWGFDAVDTRFDGGGLEVANGMPSLTNATDVVIWEIRRRHPCQANLMRA